MCTAGKIRKVSLILKSIHAQKDRGSVRREAQEVASLLRDLRMERAARLSPKAVMRL